MTEAVCRERLAVLLKNNLIDKIYVVGDKNSKGEFIKSAMTVVVDSKDRIKGLSLAKLQSEVESLLDTKVNLYELIELQLDDNLKEKLMKNKPLVIAR